MSELIYNGRMYRPEITDKTCTVILQGGLGNLMSQISALMIHANKFNLDPVLAYWTSRFSNERFNKYDFSAIRQTNAQFLPWGGHPMRFDGISLGDFAKNI